jgi:hypothetical protein
LNHIDVLKQKVKEVKQKKLTDPFIETYDDPEISEIFEEDTIKTIDTNACRLGFIIGFFAGILTVLFIAILY